MECQEARVSLGVYVLGAIDPGERALVDAHLATCRDCRDELAGLAGLPALLARVSTEEAIALGAADGPLLADPAEAAPPPELLATVLDLTATRRRRRWREAGLSIAAALIIAAGVFGGLRIGSSPAQPASTAAGITYPGNPTGPWETATGRSGSMAATVSYRSMGWGAQLETKVSGIPVGTKCQLWVIDSAGNRVLAGGWVTDDVEGKVSYPGSAALPGKDVAAFEITVGSGQAIEVSA
jgi:Putative zinc-finger